MSEAHLEVVHTLFSALAAHDHDAMANCYHEQAEFSDIAFDLRGRRRIHAMWHKICEGDIAVEVQRVEAIGEGVQAGIIDRYTFAKTGRHVENHIESRFRFRDGLIIEHRDACDALKWARQAFGGVKGEIAGRVRFLRRKAARDLMEEFLAEHPEYR